MRDRLDAAFNRVDAVLPNEFRWEDSRREGYNYSCFTYTWYHRMAERGDGAPAGVHPNRLHRGVKVNSHQRIPCSSIDTVRKAMEFETISDIFSEPFEFQRVNLQHANPEAYDEIRQFADVLPLNATSPAYPFSGFMVNFRVVTDAHKDGLDSKWCLIIFVKQGEGGQTCLAELGLKVNGKTGVMLTFTSCWITHFNSHFVGKRCSVVLHTDKGGDSWVEDSGGWADHVVQHRVTYVRDGSES
ncbi:hypothetical protein B0H19DRAFT_930816 [Mycena capillaripes]|nr:hypothetical protein B0H19DRAFT_1295348 [Mycena capillaripes]KAJ6577507.1 hypothetical protein B0H19DRAFT_930816 [Mycena capillaripes]